MEQELRRMFKNKGSEMNVPTNMPQELRRRVGRQRMIKGGLVAAAAMALVFGGFAGARSLTSDEALPPAKEDSTVSPFVDTWTTTDVNGRTRTLVIRASGEDTYEITVQNHLSLVCSGAPQTLTGTGRLFGSTYLALYSPEITCDDGSQPKVEDDPFLEEAFSDLSFEHDPESDILTTSSPLEGRFRRRDGGITYTRRTLIWVRVEAENRIGDVRGWITYGDKRGIWARDLTNPRDPSDRVRLSSTSGSLVARSSDGSKLLVQRDVQDPGVPPNCPACGPGSTLNETDLFVLNSDGTETRLTDPGEGATGGASFSPDGTVVVYAGAEGAGSQSAIYVVDAEGGTPEVLLTSGNRRYPDPDKPGDDMQSADGDDLFETALQEPQWSPDGSQIAYFDGMGDWGHSLRVMDSDGTDSRVVVENSETLGVGHVYGLQWSPDGRQLAFSIEGRLYVVGVDGSGFRLVTDNGVEPYWSPDGSHIAYTRPDPETAERGSLEIVRLDDLRVQNFGEGESGPWTSEVGWSADSR